MKRTSNSVMGDILANPVLAPKVKDALLNGTATYNEVIELCKAEGISISKSTLSRMKEKYEESIAEDIPIENLIDKREKKGNIVDISKSRDTSLTRSEAEERYDNVTKREETLFSDLELIEKIIEKGSKGLEYVDSVDVNHAMRAIELKHKITGNQLQGLTLVGLRELKVRHQAKVDAMLNAIMVFVPEEQHEELQKYIEQEEERYYENLDLTEEGRQISEALKKSGFEI